MTAGKADAIYVVHYKSGARSEPMGAERVRSSITSGQVGVDDLISRNGGPPAAFFQYDEFVDLWEEFEESFDFLMGATEEATDPDPGPGWAAPEVDGEEPDDVDAFEELVEFVGGAAMPSEPSETPHGAGGEADPSPFLPSSAPAALSSGGASPEEEGEESIIAFEDIDAIAGFEDGAGEEIESGDAWRGALDPSESGELAGYSGYDPLADLILDPMTVLELLHDSSLYSVLAANPGERGEQIQSRYLARADLLAKRQRSVPRSDEEQVRSMREIRTLVYKAYQVLLDDEGREEYAATASRTGLPATAGQVLGISQVEGAFAASPAAEELIAESLAELEDEAVETLGEQGASLGLSNEHDLFDGGEPVEDLPISSEVPARDGSQEVDPFGIDEELFLEADGPLRETGRHAVDFSDEYDPYEPEPLGATVTPVSGVRIYTSVSEAIDSGARDDLGSTGDIFGAKVPRAARIRRETAERRRVLTGLRSTGQRYSVTAATLALQQEYPEGLRWGTDDTPTSGATQAASFSAIAFLVSLAVVIVSDLGAQELDYSGHSFWFWGRGLLLIVLAVAGTLWVRGEPIQRVGLTPPIIETVMGLGIGVVLGLAASMVAPIYLAPEASLGAALGGMFFIALAHEVFFRGFVTRVLLVGLPNPHTAVLISCLLYGSFYLSYSAVLGQSGFWVLYYSVLLYGFGLGSVLALLYWKSRSIWPSVIVHFLVLAFAAMLAPGSL